MNKQRGCGHGAGSGAARRAGQGASPRAGRRAGRATGSSVLVVLVVLALVAGACRSSAGAAEARADVPRVSSPGANPAAGVTAINALTSDLYRRLAAKPGNVLFSPYSIEIALAMTRIGAKGDTRLQMDKVLHAGAGDELDKALNVLDQELATRPGHKGDELRNGDLELSTANALFGQKDTPFEQLFLESLARTYGAGIRLVDYKTAAEGARKEINQWAQDRTEGKIVDLLPAGSLNDLTRLVLTNAIYFKAPWAKQFLAVGDTPFTKADGTTISTPSMSTSKMGTYREGTGWKAAEVPYLGGELSMVMILPDDLAAFESSLSGTSLGSILNAPTEPLATLQLPKFTFRSQVQLKEQLSALGMPLAFTDGADLAGITTREKLVIKDVFHQAFIAVDEEGTEAAAATAVVVEAVSGPCCKSMVIDKAFLFAIRDVGTGAVLFFGRVSDPTAR